MHLVAESESATAATDPTPTEKSPKRVKLMSEQCETRSTAGPGRPGLAVSMVLVACGGGGIDEGSDNSDVTTATGGDPQGSLKISNGPSTSTGPPSRISRMTPASTRLTQRMSTTTTSSSARSSSSSHRGDSGGRDIIVVTDWMAEKMYNLGYIQASTRPSFPPSKEPDPSLQSPSFDFERK